MKKSIAAILSLSLFALASCGESVGDDWRTSGIVVGSGNITHSGEGSVDVLVTISSDSAAFYRDEPEQILFDSVLFPIEIADADEAFNMVSFDDLNNDGESDVTIDFIHADGDLTELVWLWDPVERYVFDYELSMIPTTADISEYVGLWEYVGENLWLRINSDETWEFLNESGEVVFNGVVWLENDSLTLHFEENGDTLRLDFSTSGDLLDGTNNGVLVPVEAITPSPYFTKNDIEIGAISDNGTYLLENGVCCYSGRGDGYSRGDCEWEVVKRRDDTHDGIREIEFDAICYIPEESIPIFDEEFLTVTSSELYDFYTGTWLTASSSYGDSNRGENYYLHTLNYGGESYLIEFSYSTDWHENSGDYAQVFTKSYVVYLPEGYDGLIFAAEPQPDNYKESEELMRLDSISPEAKILDIGLVDVENSLFFDICG